MVPSGDTRQVPLWIDGSSASKRGVAVPSGPMEARYWFTKWLSSREPPPPPPLTPSHQFFGSSFTATVRIFGVEEARLGESPWGRLPVGPPDVHAVPSNALNATILNNQRIVPPPNTAYPRAGSAKFLN